jgi:hypothetical protein
MPTGIVVLGIPYSCYLGSHLKPAIGCLKSLKRIQELQARFAHRLRSWPKLLGMLDGESDAVHGNTRLICHLEFHGSGPGR